jgi:endonuclease/exonuclease/phosphatase family metal-dependent hydrolase
MVWLLIVLAVPNVSDGLSYAWSPIGPPDNFDGQWWSRQNRGLPANLCFSGRASLQARGRTYRAQRRGQGYWIRSGEWSAQADFTASTFPQTKLLQVSGNGAGLSLCPIQLLGANGNTLRLDFENPLRLRTYWGLTYFRGSGTAILGGLNGKQIIPVRVSGYITKHSGEYRLWGQVQGSAKATVPNQYQFVSLSLRGSGSESGTPCGCDVSSECTAPELAITRVTRPINSANQESVVVSGTGVAGLTVSLVVSDEANYTVTRPSVTVAGDGTWSFAPFSVSTLHAGTLTFTVSSTSEAPCSKTATTFTTSDAADLPAADPIRLRVLSYNIHHAEGVDGKLDLQRIARVILSVQPDLVALQEVEQGFERTGFVDQPAELARLTKMHFAEGLSRAFEDGAWGNAVLSRYPIVRHTNHLLPRFRENVQRGVIEAEISLPRSKQPLLFFVTHLDFTVGVEDERIASAKAINALVAKHGDRPALLSGDLNARPSSNTLAEFKLKWYLSNTTPLLTVPVGTPTTQIDYNLYRPLDRWTVVEARVLSEAVASDHRAIFAVLELLPRVQ